MLIITLILLMATGYFAWRDYDNYRYPWAMFWAVLFGWDLHTLITLL